MQILGEITIKELKSPNSFIYLANPSTPLGGGVKVNHTRGRGEKWLQAERGARDSFILFITPTTNY